VNVSRAYAVLAGRRDAEFPIVGNARRPFGLSPEILLGRFALLALFVAIPVLNPPLARAGDERLYLGTVIALAAVACTIPSLLRGGYGWVLVAFGFAGAYVVEAGLLRGDLALGVVGNTYRPLHAMFVFCACVVLLRRADRDLWSRLFLVGGLIGCSLAVVHAFVPAVDPFGPSRPDDLPFDPLFIESPREEGAFVYPGNLGPYGAYLAVVAVVLIERARMPLVSANLYTAAFVAGIAAIAVSGSRSAIIGLVAALAVLVVRSKHLRVQIAVAVAGLAAAVVGVAWIAGRLGELFESRIGGVDYSLELRFDSWADAWDVFLENPLFGGGVFPNTIDSTFFYLIAVGGLVGLALVLAMYWTTLVRPLRRGDWTPLPVLVAALGISVFQDALGTPLVTWALGAGAFLVASPAALYEARARRGSEAPAETVARERAAGGPAKRRSRREAPVA
jgi:O-antigen ligase/polysaccharide polymerase Wzy-like membrane protein